jgi:hypothetical protein
MCRFIIRCTFVIRQIRDGKGIDDITVFYCLGSMRSDVK